MSDLDRLKGRLFCPIVPDGVQILQMSERTLRKQLEPGGALEHLAFRPSPGRVLIKVAPLLALAGQTTTEAHDFPGLRAV